MTFDAVDGDHQRNGQFERRADRKRQRTRDVAESLLMHLDFILAHVQIREAEAAFAPRRGAAGQIRFHLDGRDLSALNHGSARIRNHPADACVIHRLLRRGQRP